MTASVTTQMTFAPQSESQEAGLAAVQNDTHFYTFGLGRNAAGQTVLRVRKRAGDDDPAHGLTIAERSVALRGSIVLRISIDHADLDFAYSLDGETYRSLLDNADARVLTTAIAGGFTGAIVGIYAEGDD